MKCISCEIEINPKWRHAIDLNACPTCGGPIMDEELKKLLTTLQATMDSLGSYPEQTNDWLLSNFNFIKTDSDKLVNFVPRELLSSFSQKKKNEHDSGEKQSIKVKTENGEQDVIVEKIQDEDRTNEFFRRAEVKLKNDMPGTSKGNFSSVSDKTEHLKKLKAQIESGDFSGTGSEPEAADGFVITDSGDMQDQEIDLYAMAQESESLSNISSSSDDDDIPAAVLNMSRRAAGNKNPQSDINLLKSMHDKLNNSKKNFNGGGGSFSR